MSPMAEGHVRLLKQVRAGELSFDDTLNVIRCVEAEMNSAINLGLLPPAPDSATVLDVVHDVHTSVWAATEAPPLINPENG